MVIQWLHRFWAWLLSLLHRARRPEQVPLLARGRARSHVTKVRGEVAGPLVAHHHRRVVLAPRGRPVGESQGQVWSRVDAGRLFSSTLRTGDRKKGRLLADEEQLARYGLPVWRGEEDLAEALGVSVATLRFFSQHRLADRFFHYVQFEVPKRAGGVRTIMAPRRQLKSLQRIVLRTLVDQLPVSEHAHGFRRGRSIASGASSHVGKRVVVTMDLQDFFPTVTFVRVRGYFIAMGYGYVVAATLAALLTEAPRQVVEVNGERYYVPVGERHCVPGAPTSPGICNAIVHRMDRRLSGLASHLGFDYSRYADDLTFSGNDRKRVGRILGATQRIVESEGFALRSDKTRVAHAGSRQRVTGVTVNETLGLSRVERRRLRAMIHQHRQAIVDGVGDEAEASRRRLVEGKLAYLAMLNPEQAERLRGSLSETEAEVQGEA